MNSTDRAFIIGDVHGCFEELKQLLITAKISPKTHRIIFVGDLINKGPFSFETLQWVRENHCEVTIGNHELKFIKNAEDDNSMSPQLKQLKTQMGKDLDDWIQWIDSWPKYIESENYYVVHAGFRPDKSPEDTPRDLLANIRTWRGDESQLNQAGDRAWYSYYKNKKPVFYGHWALQGLHVENNTYCLDSGCVYGRKLTGIWSDTKELVQVDAKKIYCPIN